MTRAFRSELVKFRQPMYGVGLAALLSFMAITMVISIGVQEATADRGPAGLVLALEALESPDGLGRSLGNAVTFLGLATLAVVAVNVGGEYGYGTIRNIVVRQPRRGRLLMGKSAALLAYVSVTVALSAVAAVPLARLIAAGAGVDTTAWWTPDGLAATAAGTVNLVVACAGWAALGLVLAVVLRSAATTIGAGVAYALPVEILAGEIVGDAARWLPGQVFQWTARGGAAEMAYPTALMASIGWAAAATAIAVAVFTARQITD